MFPGSNVALITPFTPDAAKIDYDLLGELIEWHIASGTDGIMPAGCTGEAATMSMDEQKQLIRFVIEKVAGRRKVIPGTGSNNTAEALALTKYAKEVGADGALVITPYYNKPTAEGQFRHFQKLADEAKLPIVLYNVPGRTGVKMSPETIARLSNEVEYIASVKEACGSVEQVSNILELCRIEVLSGDDALTLPMYSVGASGVVSVVANLLPARVKALCDAAAAGDYAQARKIHYELLAVCKAMFVETNPICIKTAMALCGKIPFSIRMPLCEMTAAGRATVESVLRKQGLL